MNIIPIGDQIVVKLDEVEVEKTILANPEEQKEVKAQGTVVAVRELQGYENAISVGDKIIFKEWKGYEINVEGEDYTVVSEEDVLVILK